MQPTNFRHNKSKSVCMRGLTLIELMIVIAIVGILSQIAFSSYQSHIIKTRRSDAKVALIDLAARQERFYSTNNVYSNNPVSLGYGADATFPLSVGSSGSSYYNLTVTASSAIAFTAVATPTGVQMSDAECYSYMINNLGVQSNRSASNTALTSSACW